MKDKRFFVGMLVLTLVFGLISYGCDLNGDDDITDQGPEIVSTWQCTEVDSKSGNTSR
jgi:hypothetical protein